MNADSPIKRRSRWLNRWFVWYARRYVRRHFHAVRISKRGGSPKFPAGPILVVMNHPSWWDPLIGMVLAAKFTDRELYAPMDSDSLQKYRILGRLGLFGIELGTIPGARRFLQLGTEILERPQAILAITAQGQFADCRERPVQLRSGIGHLAARVGHGHILPVALEYIFWTERLPEVLVHMGQPLSIEPGVSSRVWTDRATRRLEDAQDELAELAQGRAPSAFETILRGNKGVGGVYDRWRQLKATFGRRRFIPEHEVELEEPR